MVNRAACFLLLGTTVLVQSGSNLTSAVTIDKEAPITTCESSKMSPAVERLLRPVLEARVDANAKDSTEWDDRYEAAFYNLLDSRDPNALEAQVALMAYYVGEHYGHELVEALLEHGTAADALVERYKVCRPGVSFEDRLTSIMVLRTLYDVYLDIRKSPDGAGG